MAELLSTQKRRCARPVSVPHQTGWSSNLCSLCSAGAGCLFRQAGLRLIDDIIHYLCQIPCLLKNTELAVSTRAAFQNPVYVIDLLSRSQLVHYVIDKL